MPIRPENGKRYPADWDTVVRPQILARAGHCCEGSPAYLDCRAANGERHRIKGSVVVLTIAHLDHQSETTTTAICAPGASAATTPTTPITAALTQP